MRWFKKNLDFFLVFLFLLGMGFGVPFYCFAVTQIGTNQIQDTAVTEPKLSTAVQLKIVLWDATGADSMKIAGKIFDQTGLDTGKVPTYNTGTNKWIVQTPAAGGGGGTPGGSDTYIQYNNGGVFAGSAENTWDNTDKIQHIAGSTKTDSGIYMLIQDKTLTDTTVQDTITIASGGFVKRTLNRAGSDVGSPFTVNLTSPTINTHATRLLIEVTNADTGNSITWSGSNIKFPGGVRPVSTSTINSIDLFEFIWNGVSWRLVNFIADIK